MTADKKLEENSITFCGVTDSFELMTSVFLVLASAL